MMDELQEQTLNRIDARRYRAFRWALANEHDPLTITWTDMQTAMRSDNEPTVENIDAMMDALADFLTKYNVEY